MAKMFYTMDETKAALGKSEDEIKLLAREGKLREFRDGPRLMFKADQVETLKSDAAGLAAGAAADQVGLSDNASQALGLMDSKTGSGTGTAVALKTGAEGPKEDTASGMDVGLSGSLSGSIGGGSLAGGSLGGPAATSKGTGKKGVNVFDSVEGEADPMAQTHITPPKDQINLEGVGSGSGLLDLTRETDDTSLGAALLDEISPGGKRLSPTPGAAPVGSSGSSAGMTAISPMELPAESMPGESMPLAGTPVYIEAPDPTAPAFAAVSIGGSIAVLVAIAVLLNAVGNDNPLLDARFEFVRSLATPNGPFIILGIFFVLAVILFVIGMVTSRMNRPSAA